MQFIKMLTLLILLIQIVLYKSQPMKISETGEKGSFGLLEGGAEVVLYLIVVIINIHHMKTVVKLVKIYVRDSIEYHYGPFLKI